MRPQTRVIRSECIWLKSNPVLRKYCHLSKNLFNEANYIVRQTFFADSEWIKASELRNRLISSQNYQELPEQTALRILQLVERAWKSFFQALASWKSYPEKYYNRPRLPKYKEKNGEFILQFTKAQIEFINGILTIPFIPGLRLKPRFCSIQNYLGIRIVPKGVGYVLEILYAKHVPQIPKEKPNRIVGIDIGLTNLITMVNNIGKKPIVVKGGVIKSINQYYNKEQAYLQSIYTRQGINTGKKIKKLFIKRKRKLNNFFHEVSRFIIDWCLTEQIDTIIVGYNKRWKQNIKLGKKTNQNFVSIPFNWFIQKLHYKANDNGIRMILVQEAYTSKCSFLDGEKICLHTAYQGERVSRGLYRSKKGKFINSDVNAAYNIIKKEVPNAFSMSETADGIEGVWLHPIKLKAIGQSIAS